MNLGSKQKIILAVLIVIGAILIYNFQNLLPSKSQSQKPIEQTPAPSQNESPEIVSTKPDPLEDTIITATEIIEITFNRPLENVGEFKLRMEPKIDYKLELSGDRKTAKIIPVKPYHLGTGYTIYIGTETKFDGIGRWGEEKIFHYRTIKYTGV